MDIFEVGDTVQPALEAIKDGGKKKTTRGGMLGCAWWPMLVRDTDTFVHEVTTEPIRCCLTASSASGRVLGDQAGHVPAPTAR
jgi:hypothetical protein